MHIANVFQVMIFLDGLRFREIKTIIETILIGLNTSDSNESSSGYLQLDLKKCLEQVL